MQTGIIGTRNVGRALAGGLTEAGHGVVVGSRDPETSRVEGVDVVTQRAAAEKGEVVVLALPAGAVADVAADFDGVADAAVVGTADERLGERVTAVVRVEEGTDAVTAEDVRAACRTRLADYEVPREVHFVDELPRTGTRKIDRVALSQEFG